MDYENDEDWAESWNRLRREGWLDLFGPRVDGHPLGQVIYDTIDDDTNACDDDVADENSNCGYVILEGHSKLYKRDMSINLNGLQFMQ